ncbi:hypothetical protein HMPREF0083_05844 [Aneurinibacillus aneurinilyticus ATCC 12856]|uniref:Uncharacterized protein n=1 Tax=Aneurinibacillus aneurinilyticus ATCC 12856 TaxID=649747 RepID=U1WQX3_ANEAE|nr:hypothetical protein HMPREF0083_05844 [Aneurinibacillus aneurinilyticus ATCC 12856]
MDDSAPSFLVNIQFRERRQKRRTSILVLCIMKRKGTAGKWTDVAFRHKNQYIE